MEEWMQTWNNIVTAQKGANEIAARQFFKYLKDNNILCTNLVKDYMKRRCASGGLRRYVDKYAVQHNNSLHNPTVPKAPDFKHTRKKNLIRIKKEIRNRNEGRLQEDPNGLPIIDINRGDSYTVKDAVKGRGTRTGRGQCSYCHAIFDMGWEYKTESGRYIQLCTMCKNKYSDGKISFKRMVVNTRM